MSSRSPSYITKNRLGIYILQVRVPSNILLARPSTKPIIRKSLRTRNRRVALRHARRMIVQMEESNFESLDSWEKLSEENDRQFHIGRPVFEVILSLGDIGDEYALNQYLIDLSPEQQRALRYMNKRNDKLADELQSIIKSGDAGLAQQFLDKLLPVDRKSLHEQIAKLPVNANSGTNTALAYPASAAGPSRDDPLISTLFEDWQKSVGKGMAVSSYGEYTRMIGFFIKAVTEFNNNQCPTVSQLSTHLIRQYKDALKQIPINAKTNGKSVQALIQICGKPKKVKTINGTFSNVGQFIRWIEREQYPVQSGIQTLLVNEPKIKAGQRKKRNPWDSEDLKNLFLSIRYTQGQWTRASEYWVPLIALFTGGTQGELLQLEVNDIFQDSDIYCIDINDDCDEKQLKVSSNTDHEGRSRVIPIHSQLKKLGFLKFVESQKADGKTRLFPEEKRSARGQFADYSKRFRRYRDDVGAGPRSETEFRDFHSFRHLFKTKLSDISKEEGLIDDLLGHSSTGRSVVGQGYNHSKRSILKNNLLKKLKYDEIDFDKICKWDQNEFARKAHRVRAKSK